MVVISRRQWDGASMLPWLLVLFTAYMVPPACSEAAWDTQDMEIKQGQDFTAKCTITGVDLLGVVRLSRTNPSTHAMDIISDDKNLKTKFAETGRYNISLDWKGNDLDLTLMYRGLRGEDTGEISCFQLGRKNEGASFMLRVLVPIDAVYFLVTTGDAEEARADEGGTVHLRQGQESRVTCVFERDGTLYPPMMAIEVGGQSEFGKFVRQDEPVETQLEQGGWRESMTVKLSYDTMTPPAEFNEKNLTCRGTVDGYPASEATIRLDVKFAPIITCPKYEWFGQLRRGMTITCSVHANPGSTIRWYYGPDRQNAELIEDDNDEDVFVMKSDAFNEFHSHLSLQIKRLNVSHLTNFYLSAENDIDTKEVTVTVNEGARDTDQEVKVQPKPNRPSYSTNQNKPSKRPRPRDPQHVRSGAVSSLHSYSTSLLSVTLLCSLLWSVRR